MQDIQLAVNKKADDLSLGFKVLRISIGGVLGDDKAYITYRGDLYEVQLLLAKVMQKFAEVREEPPISPDDGKKYA